MLGLGIMSTLITNITSFCLQGFIFILELSYLIGQTLVNQFLNLALYASAILSAAYELLEILQRDFCIFFQDLGDKVSYLASFVMECLIYLSGGFTNGVSVLESTGLQAFNFTTTIYQAIAHTTFNIVQFLENTLILIKYLLLLLGSSIWLSATIIPLTVTACSNLFVKSVMQISYELQKICSCIAQKITNGIKIVFLYFFDIPLESACGLLFGVIFFCLILKNIGKIYFVVTKAFIRLYHFLQYFSTNLWTGRFLENSSPSRVVTKDKNTNIKFSNQVPVHECEDKFCVVCHDQNRNVIILPCKHMCLCVECSIQIRRLQGICPICRGTVKRTMKVYV